MIESLDEIALRNNTDKSSNGHDYCRSAYEELFAPLRDDEFTLLELGVFSGQSIRTWLEYFSKAVIVGIDIDITHCPQIYSRTTLYRCDQVDPTLPRIVERHQPTRIIIDDCSHKSANTIASFDMLWPLLQPGGLYIIEDVADHDTPEASRYFQQFVDKHVMNTRESPIAWIRFSYNLVIIKRSP